MAKRIIDKILTISAGQKDVLMFRAREVRTLIMGENATADLLLTDIDSEDVDNVLDIKLGNNSNLRLRYHQIAWPTNKKSLKIELRDAGADSKISCLVRSVLFDNSRASCDGLMVAGADRKNAWSELKHFVHLCGRGTSVRSVPALDICNKADTAWHGVAISRLDNDSVRYMTGRGLSESQAAQSYLQGQFSADFNEWSIDGKVDYVDSIEAILASNLKAYDTSR